MGTVKVGTEVTPTTGPYAWFRGIVIGFTPTEVVVEIHVSPGKTEVVRFDPRSLRG